MSFRHSAAALLSLLTTPASATQSPNPVTMEAPGGLEYVQIANLLPQAPLVLDATIRSAARIRGPEAVGLMPDMARFYVQADVGALVRGTQAVEPRVGYLVDVPLDANGRAPRLKKQRVMLFARPVAGRQGELQLAGPLGQQPWTAALDARVRRIATEFAAADAPPAITGVGNAFHVAGSLPGEGETQIFLLTASGDPVSLSILRRPGEETRWAVALSEIVDEAAGPPRRDTLLWYRLACGLPAQLPATSVATMSGGDAAIARQDYQFVRRALGPCQPG